MASQVTIIDPSARRFVMKIPPGKYLSEVRDEACQKFRLDPGKYGLKNNSKQVDLTRTYRLSGLPTGAKLELVQLSKSPSAVSVALRLPESEVQPGETARLTAKFSSATSLWQILRSFESGKVGETGKVKNFTAKGVPITNGSSGRLCHHFPVLNIMGRDYTTFLELQKTLAQLGYNDGNVMIRLSFTPTQKPLEEALASMDQYFNSLEADQPAGAHSGTAEQSKSVPASEQPTEVGNENLPLPLSSSQDAANVPSLTNTGNEVESGPIPVTSNLSESLKTGEVKAVDGTGSHPPPDIAGVIEPSTQPTIGTDRNMEAISESLPSGTIPSQRNDGTIETIIEASAMPALAQPATSIPTSVPPESAEIPGITSRPITVFKAPSSQTPRAALEAHRASDYEPTIDGLKRHQASIVASTRNKRLPTDAEVLEQESVKAKKLASVQRINIKLVFPDEFKVVAQFTTNDTAANLYTHVRELLSQPNQPFSLTYTSSRVATPIIEGTEKLIEDLKLRGQTVVYVVGIPGVTRNARKDLSMKSEARQQAKEIEIKPTIAQEEEENKNAQKSRGESSSSGRTGFGSGGKPKWLKFGKK